MPQETLACFTKASAAADPKFGNPQPYLVV